MDVCSGSCVGIKRDYDLIGYELVDSSGNKSVEIEDWYDGDVSKVYHTLVHSNIDTGEIYGSGGKKLVSLLYRCYNSGEEKTLSFEGFRDMGRPHWFQEKDSGELVRKV